MFTVIDLYPLYNPMCHTLLGSPTFNGHYVVHAISIGVVCGYRKTRCNND